MADNEKQIKNPEAADLPIIPGLTLRRYRGKADIPAMAAVITRSREADGVDFVMTEEELASRFSDHGDFDPQVDILIAEADGKMIGLARVWREDREDRSNVHGHSVELLQEWRGKGIREELFKYNERHIRRITKKEFREGASYFLVWANDSDNDWNQSQKGIAISPPNTSSKWFEALMKFQRCPSPLASKYARSDPNTTARYGRQTRRHRGWTGTLPRTSGMMITSRLS